MPSGTVHIISCGTSFPENAAFFTLLKQADALYASSPLLERCSSTGVLVPEQHRISAQARQDAQTVLAAARSGKHVVVLASGDALYHGFGGTIASLMLPEDSHLVTFHPSVTAFQTLFHKLRLPWQDARLFSAHHGGHLPLREICDAALAVVYGGTQHTAQGIARAILDFAPAMGQRCAVLAEMLGTAEEKIMQGELQELAKQPCGPTSILLLLEGGTPPVLALGLPEDVYTRERNLITASDVRAVCLARLRLPARGLLWDIGAGSGSVGLEAAALRPQLQVMSVELKPERCAMVEHNCTKLGITNVVVHPGHALEVLPHLPDPDRIFLGGGGKDITALLDACLPRLKPGGFMLAIAVTLETFHALYAWQPALRRDVTTLNFAREAVLAEKMHHFQQQHTIYLFTFAP
jgi:precorrin-6B C5,15-methyltransferase / cobalt-precorrin-6B C5,C15-methyltransferase